MIPPIIATMIASAATARTRFTGCVVILPPALIARTIWMRLIMNAASTSNVVPRAKREPRTSGWSGFALLRRGWRASKFGSISSTRSEKTQANGRQASVVRVAWMGESWSMLESTSPYGWCDLFAGYGLPGETLRPAH